MVILDLSMSLDGFIAPAPGQPERLHDWMFPASGVVSDANAEVIDELVQSLGAIIMGRNSYDEGARQDGFVDNPYSAKNLVLSHDVPETLAKGAEDFIFVTDGIESALEQAKAAAGDRDIAIGGGANISQQYLKAGLVDVIEIHLVPVLLGEGLRLFDQIGTTPIELESTRVIVSEGVTHLRFRVVK